MTPSLDTDGDEDGDGDRKMTDGQLWPTAGHLSSQSVLSHRGAAAVSAERDASPRQSRADAAAAAAAAVVTAALMSRGGGGAPMVKSADNRSYRSNMAVPRLKMLAAVHWLRVGAIIAEFNMGGYQYASPNLTWAAISTR